MRYLILSDLHANWEALEAVLTEAEGRYDEAVCCGDLVGYGADPNAVVDWVREHCAAVVRGNHDKASAGRDDMEWFNPVARSAALWTREALSPRNCSYISDLRRGPLFIDSFELLHGAPNNEDEYLIGSGEAEAAFSYLDRQVAFFGHTHLQGGFIWSHGRVEGIPRVSTRAERQIVEIEPGCAYLINPGSVGQPRDGDPRAGFAIFDSEAGIASCWRVSYDVETAGRKIREAGLPPLLAERLLSGR